MKLPSRQNLSQGTARGIVAVFAIASLAALAGNLLLYQRNLYGTTAGGGENSKGTVFKVTP